jgi:diadenosine tetraphosphate (Ap4A) HIT family hydrolase
MHGEPVAEVDVSASFFWAFYAAAERLGFVSAMPAPGTDLYAVSELPRAVVKRFVTATWGKGTLAQKWTKATTAVFAEENLSREDYPISKVKEAVLKAHPVLHRLPDMIRAAGLHRFDAKEPHKLCSHWLMGIEAEAVTLALLRLLREDGVTAMKRGDRVYDHRRTALGDLSGTVRYDVLKRAGFRCELCGSPADEKALEVDHILPRKHGGKDLLENLQALCWQCNANKGDRDAIDFRAVRHGLQAKAEGCIFCELPPERIIVGNSLAVAFRDTYPVTPLHTLIVPLRHAATWFDLTDPERRAISVLMDEVRKSILEQDRTVLGFNVGMNCGDVAGQTVHHAHVHLIPRRKGDVEEPRGGVRGVIPGKAAYRGKGSRIEPNLHRVAR